MTGEVRNGGIVLHDLFIEKSRKGTGKFVLGVLPKPGLTGEEIEDGEAWVRKYEEASEGDMEGLEACLALGGRGRERHPSWGVNRGAALGPF